MVSYIMRRWVILLQFSAVRSPMLHSVLALCMSKMATVLWIFSVDIEEIKRLGKRFKKLDLDKSGSLSVDEFMSLPELQQNPLVQRVIDIFDTDGNGEVDFKGKQYSLIDSLARN